jgi:hypothetical protein
MVHPSIVAVLAHQMDREHAGFGWWLSRLDGIATGDYRLRVEVSGGKGPLGAELLHRHPARRFARGSPDGLPLECSEECRKCESDLWLSLQPLR